MDTGPMRQERYEINSSLDQFHNDVFVDIFALMRSIRYGATTATIRKHLKRSRNAIVLAREIFDKIEKFLDLVENEHYRSKRK